MRLFDNGRLGGTKYVRTRPDGVAELVFDRSENFDRYFVEPDGTVIDPDAGPMGTAELIGHWLASLGLILFVVPFLLVLVGPVLPSSLPHIGNPVPTWLALIAVAGGALVLLGMLFLVAGAPPGVRARVPGFSPREFTRLD